MPQQNLEFPIPEGMLGFLDVRIQHPPACSIKGKDETSYTIYWNRGNSVVSVPPNDCKLIDTCLRISIPDGTYAYLAPTPEMVKHKVDVANTVYVGDSCPIKVLMVNYSNAYYFVARSAPLAVLVIQLATKPEIKFYEDTDSIELQFPIPDNILGSLDVSQQSKKAYSAKRIHDTLYEFSSPSNVLVQPHSSKLFTTDLKISIPQGTYGRLAPTQHLVNCDIDVASTVYMGDDCEVVVLMINYGSRPYHGKAAALLIIELAVRPSIDDSQAKEEGLNIPRRVEDENERTRKAVAGKEEEQGKEFKREVKGPSNKDASPQSEGSTIVVNAVAGNQRLEGNTVGSKNVLTFNRGSGNFDVSLVNIEKNKVKATAGDICLGGDHFTNGMVGECIRLHLKKIPAKVRKNLPAIPIKNRAILKTNCEKAMEAFSSTEIKDYEIEVNAFYEPNKDYPEGLDFYHRLTRAELEKLKKDLSVKCTEE